MANSARDKGHNYERDLVHDFRRLGFSECETARYTSRKRDDEKVDLTGTGALNVQAKAWKSAPPYHDILKEMPVEDTQLNVVYHKRNYKGEVVVMTKADFELLIQLAGISPETPDL